LHAALPAQELLEKCHPLGMFDSIATLAVAQNMRELYRLVLVDTPLAPYFSENLTHEDLDEMNIEIMRNTLYKAYLDDFAKFCSSVGGATQEIMTDLLAFEVRLVAPYCSRTRSSRLRGPGGRSGGLEQGVARSLRGWGTHSMEPLRSCYRHASAPPYNGVAIHTNHVAAHVDMYEWAPAFSGRDCPAPSRTALLAEPRLLGTHPGLTLDAVHNPPLAAT
jgi:hypothetical protein